MQRRFSPGTNAVPGPAQGASPLDPIRDYAVLLRMKQYPRAASSNSPVHISARSNGTVNVQLILEKLNGGGRYDAAGAQVKGTGVADTLYKLKEAIDEYINPED